MKFQSKPSTIYASTKTEEALLSALQRNGMSHNHFFKLVYLVLFWWFCMESCRWYWWGSCCEAHEKLNIQLWASLAQVCCSIYYLQNKAHLHYIKKYYVCVLQYAFHVYYKDCLEIVSIFIIQNLQIQLLDIYINICIAFVLLFEHATTKFIMLLLCKIDWF